MLLIRNEQLRAFEISHLEAWLIRDMRERNHGSAQGMSDSQIPDFVRDSAARALRSGLSHPADIRTHLHIAQVLGSDFLENPAPWIRRILNDRSFRDAGARLRVIREGAERKKAGV